MLSGAGVVSSSGVDVATGRGAGAGVLCLTNLDEGSGRVYDNLTIPFLKLFLVFSKLFWH